MARLTPRTIPTLSLLLMLSACATDGWQAAVYRGVQQSAQDCKVRQQPGAAPCPTLPGYADYEAERQRAGHPRER